MSNENQVADDPAVATHVTPPVEAVEAQPSRETIAAPPVSGEATEVVNEETATESQVDSTPPSETESADGAANTDSPAATPSEEDGVTTEAATEPEPIDEGPTGIMAQAVTRERAASLPINDPEGVLLRSACVAQMIMAGPIADAGCRSARRINSDGRARMVASLIGRLVVHGGEHPEKSMEELIGDVAVGDELERFAAEGFDHDSLVSLCDRMVPAVATI